MGFEAPRVEELVNGRIVGEVRVVFAIVEDLRLFVARQGPFDIDEVAGLELDGGFIDATRPMPSPLPRNGQAATAPVLSASARGLRCAAAAHSLDIADIR